MKTLIVTQEQYERDKEVISNFDGQIEIIPSEEYKQHLAAIGIKSLPIIILAQEGRDNCLNLIKTYGRIENGNDIKNEL